MQIIPRNSTLLGDELLCATGQQSGSANDAYRNFLDTFNQVLEKAGVATATGDSAQAAQDASSAQAAMLAALSSASSQLAQNAQNIGDIQFTNQELGLLRNDLVKAGVPEEALASYDKLSQQPDGATLSQVAASLNINPTPPQLTDTDRAHLESALKKMDPSGETGKEALGQLEQGNFMGAWKTINQALAKNPNERHTFDTNDIASICKAFKFSSETANNIMGGFGSNKSLSLDASDFRRLMTPGQQELMANTEMQNKIRAALGKTLQPRMDVAKTRMEDERNAGARSSAKADQSLVHIKKTVGKKVNDNLSAALDGEHAEEGESRGKGIKGDTLKDATKADNPVLDSLKSETGRMRAAEDSSGRNGRGSSDAGKNSDDDSRKGWDSILSRTQVRPSAQQANMNGVNFNIPGANAAANTANAAKDMPQISRQAAGQVEQAVLSAMRDGSKRIDLQLSSSELGAITVALTSRNGEVSATIRSERPETTEMMARQLAEIKANLEEQGIKVEKLEVKTQLGNDDSQNWQGLDQHNMGQEENARREGLERLRALAKVRNSSENQNEAILEQPVQLPGYPAGNSSRGINIVA